MNEKWYLYYRKKYHHSRFIAAVLGPPEFEFLYMHEESVSAYGLIRNEMYYGLSRPIHEQFVKPAGPCILYLLKRCKGFRE